MLKIWTPCLADGCNTCWSAGPADRLHVWKPPTPAVAWYGGLVFLDLQGIRRKTVLDATGELKLARRSLRTIRLMSIDAVSV